ncbi:MAG TPA: hypothetical protein VGO80_03915 [Solirubrobacteraceae bacterium]|jgi:hypothetical protein|nr:hypothetical protein [Solirubrobacteraceae bacterium]
MSLRLLTVFTAVLGVLLPSSADAAAPANVSVRVEGAAKTLVERTTIRTDARTVNKDGVAGHDCTGTSVAGALEIAAAGNWSGGWSAFGYSVTRILGETHDFSTPDFFSLWINNKSASEGVCGMTSELQEGDSVLFYVTRCVFDAVLGDCSNEPVLPLGLTAPKQLQPDVPFDVSVVQYSPNAVASPVAGAVVVDGAVALATTNAAGIATITFSSGGPRTLKATKPGRARSAAEAVCATTGSDGFCGSATATSEPAPAQQACDTDGRDGRCGTRDVSAPGANIRAIAEGRRFGRGFGPRVLRVGVDPDTSGLLAVKLRLTRIDHGRCSYFSGKSERFVITGRGRCRASDGLWFAVGDRQETSYLLPSRLPRGRYVLDANAIDKAYNRDDRRRRGGNRVVFRVG